MNEVNQVVMEYDTFEKQNTIDIWIAFAEDKVTLSYKNQTIDVTQYKLTG